MLQDAGYSVLEACNADLAIQILEDRNDIAAIFTDITMPGSLDGLKLAHAVRDRWPPIHILVTSGLSAPMGRELPGNARFLRKPYAPKHILKAIDELVSPDRGPYRSPRYVAQSYGKVT